MKTSRFKVLHICIPEVNSTYPPIYQRDSEAYPELVVEVDDEADEFVINLDTLEVYKADEFFSQTLVREFTAEVMTSEPDIKWP